MDKDKDIEYYLNLEYEIKLRKLSQEEGGGWFAEIREEDWLSEIQVPIKKHES